MAYGRIYKATNRLNGKAYIGLTKYSIKSRITSHVSSAKRGSTYLFHAAIRKHGIDVFDVEQLVECETMQELGQAEIRLIAEHGTHVKTGNGYNVSWGGECGPGNKEFRPKVKKPRKSTKGIKRGPASPQHRLNMSIAVQKGYADGTRDRKKCVYVRSKETLEKLSISLLGVPRTEAAKMSVSLGQVGKVRLTTQHLIDNIELVIDQLAAGRVQARFYDEYGTTKSTFRHVINSYRSYIHLRDSGLDTVVLQTFLSEMPDIMVQVNRLRRKVSDFVSLEMMAEHYGFEASTFKHLTKGHLFLHRLLTNEVI